MEFDLSKKYCFYFNEISKIPRGSRNEKAISDYVVNFAKQRGYHYLQDDTYNVIVDMPASPGYENSETVLLQAHMDMVCEKNKDVEHDFEKDPLDLYVDEEGWLCARGTTLGADDGMGVAYMLAILDDPSLKHPPLQCVFTTMEEIGLLGALNLKREYFHGTRYINLDEGGEVQTCTTSSGGARTVMSKKLTYLPNEDPAYRLEIRGLKGGHSAGCIHLEPGNAILLAARVLETLSRTYDIRLVDYNGGMKFNAIPRESDIVFTTSADYGQLKKNAEKCFTEIAAELQYSDAGFHGGIVKADTAEKALSTEETSRILQFLTVIPNGLLHHSMAIKGLSTASLNAGVIRIDDGVLYVDDLIRSAAKSHGDTIIRQLEILSPLFGFKFELSDRYLGWDFEKDSKMREILREVLKEKGIKMKEIAIHGGLECGVFKGLIPELDIVTYGPIGEGMHTPDERLNLASFDRAYENLLKILEKCI
ncbi:MAG: beta-Ala-His dipeptidase [Erysipelotrichaceae bacterium]|nr:beta-Ala-His dipeptidase [Erysipelotrichaceae bacterium]